MGHQPVDQALALNQTQLSFIEAPQKAMARRQALGLAMATSNAECDGKEKAAREQAAREKTAQEKAARDKVWKAMTTAHHTRVSGCRPPAAAAATPTHTASALLCLQETAEAEAARKAAEAREQGTEVIGVRHNHGSHANGQYPHFRTSSWSDQIGTTTWKTGEGNYHVWQVRGGKIIWSGRMTMWPRPNCPDFDRTNTEFAHARRQHGSSARQWQVGDLMFSSEAAARKAIQASG